MKIIDNKLIIDVNDDNIDDVIKMTPKVLRRCKKNITYGIKYKDEIVTNDKNILKYDDKLKRLIEIVNAVNIRNKMERYSYIYDKVCDYLDEEWTKNNYCDFKDNICICSRTIGDKCHKDGCCSSDIKGACKYLVNKKCSIKSMSCKLHSCRYLKRNNIRFHLNNIPLTKYFLNDIQRMFLRYNYFKTKEEVLPLLMYNPKSIIKYFMHE